MSRETAKKQDGDPEYRKILSVIMTLSCGDMAGRSGGNLFNGNGSLTPTSSHARFYAARSIGWAGGKLFQDVLREHLDVK